MVRCDLAMLALRIFWLAREKFLYTVIAAGRHTVPMPLVTSTLNPRCVQLVDRGREHMGGALARASP